jgi:hypothetical protein
MTHPNPLQWIWYTFGGTVGPMHRGWVLRDVTGPGRWVRQLVRALVQISPLAVLVLVVLGNNWIAWTGVACGALLAIWYSVAFINQTAERRLVQHGYEPGTLALELRERDRREHPDRIVRYMQRYRNAAE